MGTLNCSNILFSKTKGGHWVKSIFNRSENIINFLVYNPKMINSLYHKYCFFSKLKQFIYAHIVIKQVVSMSFVDALIKLLMCQRMRLGNFHSAPIKLKFSYRRFNKKKKNLCLIFGLLFVKHVIL